MSDPLALRYRYAKCHEEHMRSVGFESLCTPARALKSDLARGAVFVVRSVTSPAGAQSRTPIAKMNATAHPSHELV